MLVVSVLPPAGGGTLSCALPYHGGGVGRGARLLPPLSRIRRLGHHLRHRLCAVHGGRGPPYHSGSCSPGFSGYDLCGVPVRRRGPACSSRPPCEPAAGTGGRVTLRLPSRAGGAHPPCPGGWGPGPPRLAGWWGGGGGGCRAAASLFSFRAAACGTPFRPSPCRRRAPFRRARAVGAEVPPRARGGVRGGPWTAPPGAPADVNPPSVTSEWAVVTGGSCGARPPSCSVVRVAPGRQCGFAGAGPAAVALTASPFLLRGGAPPRPWGGGGPRLWLPSRGGCGGGGVGGPPPRPLSGLCGRGGGEWGGPFGPLAMPPVGRGGGGGMAVLAPGASHRPGGCALPPRGGFSRRPSLGPLIPRPLSRGAGRPGVAVRVSRQWLAGCGAAGSPPRSLSPHFLPREVARPLASCRTVGGAWAVGPNPPPQLSRTRRLGLHLRRRLCRGWGCGGGGLCRR